MFQYYCNENSWKLNFWNAKTVKYVHRAPMSDGITRYVALFISVWLKGRKCSRRGQKLAYSIRRAAAIRQRRRAIKHFEPCARNHCTCMGWRFECCPFSGCGVRGGSPANGRRCCWCCRCSIWCSQTVSRSWKFLRFFLQICHQFFEKINLYMEIVSAVQFVIV